MKTFLLSLCLCLPLLAQDVQVFDWSGPRAASNIVFFGENMMVGLSLNYGQPEWKEHYDGMQDGLKGKLSRLGKDFWTTLATTAPVELGGVKVDAGNYVVGLHCSDKGEFALALLEASKAMKGGILPFGPQAWKPDYVCPVKFHKNASEEVVEKMTMELKTGKEDKAKGHFQLMWGKHKLHADLNIHIKK